MSKRIFQSKASSEESWISVSDIMAGLMMVFLFIAVVYAREVQQSDPDFIVSQWNNIEGEIVESLHDEFEDDLPRWNAEIDNDTLTVRFQAPRILFAQGADEIPQEFKVILAEFMPRYINLLVRKFDGDIDEVRIEGHTSSRFDAAPTKIGKFTENMKLSQARTRSVLEFSLALPALRKHTDWMIKHVSANGLSSAKPILTNGVENPVLSRRVEFTIKTNAREVLREVISTHEARQ